MKPGIRVFGPDGDWIYLDRPEQKLCYWCNAIGYHFPGCPHAEVEHNTHSVTYPPQQEQIIRPTEHADLLRLIDGLRQTMQRRGLDVGEGDAAAVVSAAEFILRNLDSYLREMEEQSNGV